MRHETSPGILYRAAGVLNALGPEMRILAAELLERAHGQISDKPSSKLLARYMQIMSLSQLREHPWEYAANQTPAQPNVLGSYIDHPRWGPILLTRLEWEFDPKSDLPHVIYEATCEQAMAVIIVDGKLATQSWVVDLPTDRTERRKPRDF